jgi:AcrR family transcriptional regulator
MEASSKVPLRRTRERELVTATRSLFDERGMQHAPIEEIAKAAGIARGLIYRQFSSKEELFVLTVTDYLDELAGRLEETVDPEAPPTRQMEACAEAYADFCLRYPAFLDAALALMQRPAMELFEIVSDSVWLRLGTSMSRCVEQLTQILERGNDSGDFDVADPAYTANLVWTQTLGAMHLARIGVGIRHTEGGAPDLFTVDPKRVVASCVEMTMAALAPRDG